MNIRNTKQKDRGFTIVELLVVIVVIGILAAITIVSYSGITARANTQANKSNASSVLNAALVVYANTGSFPAENATAATQLANLNASDAKIPSSVTVANTQISAGSNILYKLNAAATGVCVGYWDYTLGTPGANWLYGGSATTGTNASTPTCT